MKITFYRLLLALLIVGKIGKIHELANTPFWELAIVFLIGEIDIFLESSGTKAMLYMKAAIWYTNRKVKRISNQIKKKMQ